jgi:hypothetical protein
MQVNKDSVAFAANHEQVTEDNDDSEQSFPVRDEQDAIRRAFTGCSAIGLGRGEQDFPYFIASLVLLFSYMAIQATKKNDNAAEH